MPSTFIGLLIFIVLLSPGLTYSWAKERSLPSLKLSVFRETATVAFVSTVSVTAASVIFSIFHLVLPATWTPNVGEMVRNPGDYLQSNYVSTFWWAIAVLLLAIILALTCGSWLAFRNFVNRMLFAKPNPDRFQTEWEAAFTRAPGSQVVLTLVLEDGRVVTGDLSSRTAAADETVDREITLDAPIFMQVPGAPEAVEIEVDCIVVSARRISAIMVNYVT
ncbi:DUF6338 family protein [Streptomyces sp. NBC_00280]|uniref:DUF6338 family protein n=1 Tax=Streptomyces sp. NBC_00280 TaxID=2975699 RepID=UPI003248AF15